MALETARRRVGLVAGIATGTHIRLAVMKNGLVYLRPQRMVYVRAVGPYEQSIPEAWNKMFAWIAKHAIHSPAGRGYGLAHDAGAKTAEPCYDACVQLTPLFEERAIREHAVMMLPGGPYMRHRYIGRYNGVSELLSDAQRVIELPADLRIDQRRPLVTIYLDDPAAVHSNDLRADICLPVAANSASRAA